MNMTLDEAIEHCDEVVQKEDCSKCAKEHEQLKEWLEELKELKNPQPYKFEDLNSDMWVWDNDIKEVIHIRSVVDDDLYFLSVGEEDVGYAKFEEERFFPVTKTMEYQE